MVGSQALVYQENPTFVVSSDKRSKPNEVESLQAPNKRAKIEKRANSLKYFIILILIQFVNMKKEVKKIHRVV